jgi:hypothetical protein
MNARDKRRIEMIFRKNNGSIENELAELQSRRSTWNDKLVKQQVEVETAITARRLWPHGPDADDDRVGKQLDKRVTEAVIAEKHLKEDLEQIDKIADAKQRLDAERDRQERATAARELTAKADALTAKTEVLRIAAIKAVEALIVVRGGPYVSPEALQRVADLVRELPVVMTEFAETARAHAKKIESGAAPIPGKPIKVEQAAPEPQIERTSVYMLEHGRWREGDIVKTARQYSMADLPIEVAARALEHRLAVDPTSETFARLRDTHGVVHGFTHVDLCTDLQTGEKPDGAPKYFEVSGEPVLGERVVGVASVS